MEFASPVAGLLEPLFEKMGFSLVAKHRSKDVVLYRQGDINFIVNREPKSLAGYFAAEHGPCACALAFRVKDSHKAYERALEMGAQPVDVPTGPMELRLPAIKGIGGAPLYLIDRYEDGKSIYDIDFEFLQGVERHQQEIYSIDECFLDLGGIPGDLVLRSRKIRSRILRATKIPTCVGIGPTKTLAKLANHIAKTAERKPGSYPSHLAQVCHLGAISEHERQALLQATEVGEVWGVGRRIGAQLQEAGIHTVWDLAQMNPSVARQRWSVVLEKTIRELQGTPCFTFEDQPPHKQQIACTRSFGHPVTGLVELQEAITAFACRAAEKLRQQDGHAGVVMVFIRTSPFRQQDAQYSGYRLFKLLEPTSDSARITQAALAVLRTIYKPGFNYAKAGVMLMELIPASQHQFSLDLGPEPDESRGRLMTAMDALNKRFGKGTLTLGTAGVANSPKQWAMKQERRTPRYTTRWDELLTVKC